jgi:hypothetical protein
VQDFYLCHPKLEKLKLFENSVQSSAKSNSMAEQKLTKTLTVSLRLGKFIFGFLPGIVRIWHKLPLHSRLKIEKPGRQYSFFAQLKQRTFDSFSFCQLITKKEVSREFWSFLKYNSSHLLKISVTSYLDKK